MKNDGRNLLFNIGDRQIRLPIENEEYYSLRRFYEMLADELADAMILFCMEEIHSFEDIYEKGIVYIKNLEALMTNKSIKVLMEYDIDYVDDERFSYEMESYLDLEKELEYLIEIEEMIEQEIIDYENRQAYKKANRGRWTGGGFGLGGALKGAVMAGALNLGTSMVRGVVDGASSLCASSRVVQLKHKILEERKYMLCLRNATYNMVCAMFECVYDILVDEDKIEYVSYDIDRTTARVNNIMRLYCDGELTREVAFNKLVECKDAYPYHFYYNKCIYELAANKEKVKQDLNELENFLGGIYGWTRIQNNIDEGKTWNAFRMPERSEEYADDDE